MSSMPEISWTYFKLKMRWQIYFVTFLTIFNSHLVSPQQTLAAVPVGDSDSGTSSSFLSSAVLALVTSSTLIALTETAEADRLRILALYMLLAVDGMAVSTIRMPMSMSMMLIPAATIAQVILTMPTTTMTPEPNEPCPVNDPGWATFGGSCYFFSTTPRTWDDAQTFCQNRNGSLAEIETTAENDFLKTESMTQLGLMNSGVWIGGRDRNLDMTFTWESTGDTISVDVLDWDEFNSFPMGNECLLIYLSNGNRKRDQLCADMEGLICERPA